jgi:flagellar motor switch protein FliM
MSSDLLSQDEIDALLHGVDSGVVELDEGKDGDASKSARSFDFTTQERIVRGRMPTIEMVNERFSRQFRVGVYGLLRRSAEISVRGVEMLKFADYTNSLLVPSSISLTKVKPLRGTAMVVFEPRLVFTLVDNFFGGDGRYPAKIEGREFTPMELRVVHLLLKQVYADMMSSWAPVLPLEFEFVQHEVNPHFANIVAPREYVVVSRFHVELEGGSGLIHITMPYSMLEPHRALLDAGMQSDRNDKDEHWPKALRRELDEARVQISGLLARVHLPLRELLALKKGDIIELDSPPRAEVLVEQVPLFRGEFGVTNGHKAIQISEVLRPSSAVVETQAH